MDMSNLVNSFGLGNLWHGLESQWDGLLGGWFGCLFIGLLLGYSLWECVCCDYTSCIAQNLKQIVSERLQLILFRVRGPHSGLGSYPWDGNFRLESAGLRLTPVVTNSTLLTTGTGCGIIMTGMLIMFFSQIDQTEAFDQSTAVIVAVETAAGIGVFLGFFPAWIAGILAIHGACSLLVRGFSRCRKLLDMKQAGANWKSIWNWFRQTSMYADYLALALALYAFARALYKMLKKEENKTIKEGLVERFNRNTFFNLFDTVWVASIVPLLALKGPDGVKRAWYLIRMLCGFVLSAVGAAKFMSEIFFNADADEADGIFSVFTTRVKYIRKHVMKTALSESESDDCKSDDEEDEKGKFETLGPRDKPKADEQTAEKEISEQQPAKIPKSLWRQFAQALGIGKMAVRLRRRWIEIKDVCQNRPIFVASSLLIMSALVFIVVYVIVKKTGKSESVTELEVDNKKKKKKHHNPSDPSPGEFETPEEVRRYFKPQYDDIDHRYREMGDEAIEPKKEKVAFNEMRCAIWQHDRMFGGYGFKSPDDVTDQIVINSRKGGWTKEMLYDEMDDPSSYMSYDSIKIPKPKQKINKASVLIAAAVSPNAVPLSLTSFAPSVADQKLAMVCSDLELEAKTQGQKQKIALDVAAKTQTAMKTCLYWNCKQTGHELKECPLYKASCASKPCSFFQKGKCKFGEKCLYQHKVEKIAKEASVNPNSSDGLWLKRPSVVPGLRQLYEPPQNKYSETGADRVKALTRELDEMKAKARDQNQIIEALLERPVGAKVHFEDEKVVKEQLLNGPQFHPKEYAKSIGYARVALPSGGEAGMSAQKTNNKITVMKHIYDNGGDEIKFSFHVGDQVLTWVAMKKDSTICQEDFLSWNIPQIFNGPEPSNSKLVAPLVDAKFMLVAYSTYEDFLKKNWVADVGRIESIVGEYIEAKASSVNGNCTGAWFNTDGKCMGFHQGTRGNKLRAVAATKELQMKLSSSNLNLNPIVRA